MLDSPVTIDQFDFQPGGAWRFVQRDSEGNEFAFRGEFLEIERPSRVVQTFEFEPIPGHIIVETMTLEERDGRTAVTAVSQYANLADLEGMVQSGMESGSEATYNRLEKLWRRGLSSVTEERLCWGASAAVAEALQRG